MDAALTIETPPRERKPWQITPENARAMQAKGEIVKKARQKQLEAEAEAGRVLIRAATSLSRSNVGKTEEIIGIETERARLLALMQATTDGAEIARLAGARDKLLDEWQVLTGTPNPGQCRGRQDRPRPPEVHCSPIPTPQETTH